METARLKKPPESWLDNYNSVRMQVVLGNYAGKLNFMLIDVLVIWEHHWPVNGTGRRL